MDIKIEEGHIKIAIFPLLECLDQEDLLKLADDLSVMSSVIEYVSQQIITGWTEAGSHGGRGIDTNPVTALDKAIREVAKMSGEVAKHEIERLERISAQDKTHHTEIWEWAWKMYHAWPEEHLRSRPSK